MKNVYVRDFGAVGDGVHLDTAAIQSAIDDCSQNGGGKVTLSAGRFLSTRIDLKSGVELHLERDAVLLMSADGLEFEPIVTDFWRTEYAPRFNSRCFIYAENCEDIAITGRGVIDCQGEAYVDPIPEGTHCTMSFKRKPFPVEFTKDAPEIKGDVLDDGSHGHPVDPRKTSLAPARVVFFIGCKNVLIEDVTMRNQPAGWSYWICDCDNVHITKICIDARLDMPNNDGIHINCSRNVTVSDCNISCGDDGVCVRAYSAPLKAPKVCEKVCVTNCNISSHASGVRVGWIGDGTIRNCSFSNLNITESQAGIVMRLPGNPLPQRISDQGFEMTHIENITFSNITMDRIYTTPVKIILCEDSPIDAVTNIYFSQVHAYSSQMPIIVGRSDKHVGSVYFDGCHFTSQKFEEMKTRFSERYAKAGKTTMPPDFRNIDNLVLNSTVFKIN